MLAVGVALMATFVLCFPVGFQLLDRAYKRPVDERTSKFMPVLVLTPGHIEVMQYSAVDDYIGLHPNYTFLIPRDQLDFLGQQLRASPPSDVLRTFQVEQLSND